jgi:hypothetical protein
LQPGIIIRLHSAAKITADVTPIVKTNLVFQNNETGDISIWYMDGTTCSSTATLPLPAFTVWGVSNHKVRSNHAQHHEVV